MGQEALERGRVEGGRVLCASELSFPGALAWKGQTPEPVLCTGPTPQSRFMRPWWFPRPSMGLSQAPGGAGWEGSFWSPEADLLCEGPRGHKEGRSYESLKALCLPKPPPLPFPGV